MLAWRGVVFISGDDGLVRRQTYVADRITFRLCVYVFLCLHGMAPSYLSELCRSVSESEGRRHLRSSGRSQLVVPRYSLATVGRRAFGYAGPKA